MRALVQRVTGARVTVVPAERVRVGDSSNESSDGSSNDASGDSSEESSTQGCGEVVGEIGPGLCVLVGVTHTDDESAARKLAAKVANLRVFDDAAGAMNHSLLDAGGSALVVSQFTLYGDTARGRRPSWVAAARPEHAQPLVEVFAAELVALGVSVETGRFRAEMQVALVNDGPVTVLVEVP